MPFRLLLSVLFLCSLTIANSQVTLYSASEYRGLSIQIQEGTINNMTLTAIGNDRLASMVVPKGYLVTLYEHVNFQGYAETFNASVLNMPTRLVNQVSSIVVTRTNGNGWVAPEGNGQAGWNNNEVFIFSECYYQGSSNRMLPTDYPTMPANFHRRLSSIRIPAGYEVDLFTEANYRGRVVRLRVDQPCVPAEWNNIVASMKIYKNNTGYLPPDNYNPWSNNSGYSNTGNFNSTVNVFPLCDYKGLSTPLTDGEYADLPYNIRNRIYSVQVPQGKEVLLYSGRGFTGSYLQLIGDKSCMAHNNEFMVNSIRIRNYNQSTTVNNGWNGAPPRPTPTQTVQEIQVFNNCNYRGKTASYPPGEYPTLLFTFSNNISSIKVPPNRRIILYTGVSYTGSSYILTSDSECLIGAFNNKIRSAIVEAY